jgi:hypothetical protein
VLAVEDPDNVVDPVVMAERRARRAELAEEELRELLREAELGAATLKGRLSAVEGELATARAQRDGLAADLARRERPELLIQQGKQFRRRLGISRARLVEQARDRGSADVVLCGFAQAPSCRFTATMNAVSDARFGQPFPRFLTRRPGGCQSRTFI